MEKTETPSSFAAEEKRHEDEEELLLVLAQLPRAEVCGGYDLYQYQGFWCPSNFIRGVISSQKHFQAEESDIVLSTCPKSGTTWLKALAFTILNRSRYASENSPLHSNSPHRLIPLIEMPDLECLSSSKTRILATHLPYASLPRSIPNSNCRIVYICRNPLDQFISEWQFIARRQNLEPATELDLGEAFDRACNGIQIFGPVWEHMLGYWNASSQQPDKILFLKYEDLKVNIEFYIKRLADFMGCPISDDEVNQGVVHEISKLCSFDNISNLEVTKTGRVKSGGPKNSLFLRKGEVGDWKNYLTPSMSQRLMGIVEEKLVGSGLTFKTSMEEPRKTE